MKRAIKWLAIAVAILVVWQCASWLLYGRAQFDRMVAVEVAIFSCDRLIVNEDTFIGIPQSSQQRILESLRSRNPVTERASVPADWYWVGGRNAQGHEVRNYSTGCEFAVGDYVNNPLHGGASFSVWISPLAGQTYRFGHVWILGTWMESERVRLIALS